MSLLPSEIIRKKRNGFELESSELKDFFQAYLEDKIPDYQASSLLMAIYFSKLTFSETATLTEIMAYSGEVLSFPESIKELCVDKHSTGGIGDKTSLIILPLAILENCYVPMMAGRGLGHTGGTVDKIESIPGIKTRFSIAEAKKLIDKNHGFLIGQSQEIAPLDFRLYHLRDVTATIESPFLIVGSILSKKIAEGISHLVMDVKAGSGAFFTNTKEAKEFSNLIIKVGKLNKLNTTCLITNMNNPLGRTAGNALEIKECIDILNGQGPQDTKELSIELAAKMVQLVYPNKTTDEIKESMRSNLSNGRAFECFKKLLKAQGADLEYIDNPQKLPKAKNRTPFLYKKNESFIKSIDVRKLGLAIIELGGGRKNKDSIINYAVGLSDLKHVGEKVSINEPLLFIEHDNSSDLSACQKLLETAFEFSSEPIPQIELFDDWEN